MRGEEWEGRNGRGEKKNEGRRRKEGGGGGEGREEWERGVRL